MIKASQVKHYRKSLGLTQAQFAEKAGVSCDLVRKHWEVAGISDKNVMKARVILEIVK